MTDVVQEADRRLAAAVDALEGTDPTELPDEIAEDVEHALFAILAAKGNCEARRSEVSAE